MKRSLSGSLGLTIQDGGDSGNKFVEMATRKDPTRDPEGSRVLEKRFFWGVPLGYKKPYPISNQKCSNLLSYLRLQVNFQPCHVVSIGHDQSVSISSF